MDGEPVQRESFIVRVWWKPGQAAEEAWIQHIRSGEAAAIHDLKGAVAFIQRWAPLCPLTPAAQAQVAGTEQTGAAAKDGKGLR